MKRIIFLLSVMVLCGCQEILSPEESLIRRADVYIISWGRTGDYTTINYDIKNTGDVDIKDWYASFKIVTVADTLQYSQGGSDLLVGDNESYKLRIATIDEIIWVRCTGIKY